MRHRFRSGAEKAASRRRWAYCKEGERPRADVYWDVLGAPRAEKPDAAGGPTPSARRRKWAGGPSRARQDGQPEGRPGGRGGGEKGQRCRASPFGRKWFAETAPSWLREMQAFRTVASRPEPGARGAWPACPIIDRILELLSGTPWLPSGLNALDVAGAP